MASAEGVRDLLGLLAYAELVAFFRLSEDAALAPSLSDKAALGEMAVAEFGHFQLLRDQIARMDVPPEQAMLPFVGPLDDFHARTAPSNWLEGLVKAYVGDGIAADFYRAIAELLDPPTRQLVLDVLADTGHADFVTSRVRAAIDADPAVAGRWRSGRGAWWGRLWRRLTGWRPSAPRWRGCWPARSPARTGRVVSRVRSAGCSRGSPTRTTSGWPRSAWPAGNGCPRLRRRARMAHRLTRGRWLTADAGPVGPRADAGAG